MTKRWHGRRGDGTPTFPATILASDDEAGTAAEGREAARILNARVGVLDEDGLTVVRRRSDGRKMRLRPGD